MPSRKLPPCRIECPFDSTIRTEFSDTNVGIYAWPSLGGVIILDYADAIDFEFLGLDPVDPPLRRPSSTQVEEDGFAQRLLLLGAKWWDSEFRYSLVSHLEERGSRSIASDRLFGHIPISSEPEPTMREKRWVKVGWPLTITDGDAVRESPQYGSERVDGDGGDPNSSGNLLRGLWVAEFDTTYAGVDQEDNLLPYDEGAARVRMARTMDERCTILRNRFQATFYSSLAKYEGYAFLKSWDEKVAKKEEGGGQIDGEVGPLLQPEETVSLWKDKMRKSELPNPLPPE